MSLNWEKCVLDSAKIESFKQNKNQYLTDPKIEELIKELTDAFNDSYGEDSLSGTSDDQEDSSSETLKNHQCYKEKDLVFAVKMYKILEKFGFAERYAAHRLNWVFLGACIHHLIQKKYPKTTDISEFNRKYISNHRSWLRTLWWTVHLFIDFTKYQINWIKNNSKLLLSTELKEYLSKFEIDYPKQIMDRVGNGYLVDFYRIFMDKFIQNKGTFVDKHKKPVGDREALRAIIKFNTAKIVLIEPYFYYNVNVNKHTTVTQNIEEYVKWLFKETMMQYKQNE